MTTYESNAPPSAWEHRLLGVVTATLVVFGVAAVYSASGVRAMDAFDNGSWFARRQLLGAVFGIGLLLLATRIEYHFWERNASTFLLLSVPLLLLLLLPFTQGLVVEQNGSRRWLRILGLTFQPSEIAKFSVLTWAAWLAAKKRDGIREFKKGILPFAVVILPIAGLVFLQPDMSTACLIILLGGIAMFTAGARLSHFVVIGGVALLCVWQSVDNAPYQLKRILLYLCRWVPSICPMETLTEVDWQIEQSLIAIGSGQLFGVGFAQSLQKLGYLPFAYTDFIFSTIGEEWGFFGVALTILLYAIYIGVGLKIARTAPDNFGMYLAVGITSLIGVTALLHMAVTLALVPATGLPLPFISYGRSNMIVALFSTGVLINIGAARLHSTWRR